MRVVQTFLGAAAGTSDLENAHLVIAVNLVARRQQSVLLVCLLADIHGLFIDALCIFDQTKVTPQPPLFREGPEAVFTQVDALRVVQLARIRAEVPGGEA